MVVLSRRLTAAGFDSWQDGLWRDSMAVPSASPDYKQIGGTVAKSLAQQYGASRNLGLSSRASLFGFNAKAQSRKVRKAK